ncbi:hypothetical protein SERLA73DRAFT_78523 [Serpula lacrymans var. lacrymans S7.3]|uniref:Secreted protein n=2 Tax=Serpula lacrymans var. lacrymans TaxID=341189 RepID=F8QDI4_SERL3|nr:uncharacterized protein SERLADRAFT_443565 [Serpula lacrymans var. lacrymans S7.9]EGN93655.1 hypothetical protein SERLA73DRAFT_78523 [Serpula lacrymans var. lacrymans S7.3]EGO19032.1 hypothetical protein SERLADRAFT_443565 [Serpula lacrymans var. lacrymans S7.9]
MRVISSPSVFIVSIALSSTWPAVHGAPSGSGSSNPQAISAQSITYTHHHGRSPSHTYEARQSIPIANMDMNIDENLTNAGNTSYDAKPVIDSMHTVVNPSLPVKENATVDNVPIIPQNTPLIGQSRPDCSSQPPPNDIKCYYTTA